NFDTGKLVAVDDDLLPSLKVSDGELERYLERVTGGHAPAAPLPAAELDATAKELASLAPKLWIRGKQEAWLTAMFISRLAPALKASGIRAGARVAISPASVLELLAPKCDIPDALDAFLVSAFGLLPAVHRTA
ncbi:MAG: hypothetical protein WC655_19950, partial [Candidatus Hydrogenedentales bacterium]